MNRPINATSYLILAMRERWLNLILDGKKTAEVRRTRPARPCDMPDYLYLYHRGHIHGMAEVVGIRLCERAWLDLIYEDYGKGACLSWQEFSRYMGTAKAGVVYRLGKVQRFEKPIPVPCRPQSWQYATPELLDIINGKKTTRHKARKNQNRKS